MSQPKAEPVQTFTCLSRKDLMNYVSGHLNEKEKSRIEKHLLSCENCISEYQKTLNKKDASDANRIFSELFEEPFRKKIVEPRTDKKKQFIALFIVAAIILFGLTYFKLFRHGTNVKNNYTNNSEIQKSYAGLHTVQTTGEKGIEISPESKDKIKKETIINPTLESNRAIEPKEAKLKESKLNISIPPQSKADQIPDPNPAAESKQKKLNPQEEKKITPGDQNQPVSSPVLVYINNYKIFFVSKNNSQGITSDDSYKKELEFIFKQIDKSQYADALNEINHFLSDYPNDINGIYYRGFASYSLEKNENAISDFESVINSGNKTFYSDACWYKILILNRQKKFDEARILLNKLISENNSYSGKAKQLLDLIGEK